jgi:hypothetical protein
MSGEGRAEGIWGRDGGRKEEMSGGEMTNTQ